jgi:TonB dependent receptor/Carboxypeptidase regulatory-like domain/TonB-dependent Receptor Plug Domain
MKRLTNRTILPTSIMPTLPPLLRSTPLLAAALLCAGSLFLGQSLSAQTTSTIQGTVTDRQGLAVSGAELQLSSDVLGTNRVVRSDESGSYQFVAVPAGIYSLKASHAGFAARLFDTLEVTLNRTLTFNITLELGRIEELVNVSAELPLLETNSSSSGATILPQEIDNMPINGRNYLDLLQLVPGVAINRQADANSDTSTPILGERANNTGFLIDGLPNQNELTGGAAAQFNQDTISEFQVVTTGYKAEFGHASGGLVNVITKSGGNKVHGVASVYHRNSAFDSSDISGTDAPYLLRWDYDLALGGPIIADKFFWFVSGENIHENRQLNFTNPPNTPQFILDREETFNQPTTNREARVFAKLDQVFHNHHLTEEFNYTNLHINSTNPLSASTSLPSTRTNLGDRNLLIGAGDTYIFGNSGSPYILNLRGQYRREPTLAGPAHPDAGPNTIFSVFSDFDTEGVFGDLGSPQFGALFTDSTLDQQYGTFGASAAKTFGRHTVKFGWDFERTQVDGVEGNAQQDQLFATQDDFEQFGPINAGFFLLLTSGGLTPQTNEIHLRNNYNGLYVQDDWKVTSKLTINAGVRWDYDSTFGKKDNVAPRLGFAWSVTPKTVIRGSWGLFYDHFRLGIGRDIPGFGGADIRQSQPFSFPRLFYGVPTIAPGLFGLCTSPSKTDAQLAAAGATCPFAPGPIFGIDHLNGVVAPGHAPIPANSVVNVSNVQDLTGLTPDAFLTAADTAVGMPPGFFSFQSFGALSFFVSQPSAFPVTVDPHFATPYSRSLTFGVQHQATNDLVISADFYHKGIENILGVRETNLPFEARIDGSGALITPVNGFGPWYSGLYNAGIFSFQKRMSHHYLLGGSYTFASENDNALCSQLGVSALSAQNCYATDSFRGVAPVVTDPGISDPTAPCPGGTNADAAFFACNGSYVPKAGVFYNGANLDSGPSDFALRHTFELHGIVELPWKIQLSSLFRAQSGFRYTNVGFKPIDQDGNGQFNGRDLKTGRNAFSSPPFVNMDLRVAKTFVVRERFRIQAMFEFFNLFNNANPAAIQNQESQADTLGTVSQRLPGREGQIGLRIEF